MESFSVMVIGAGIAGMSAASVIAESGRRVVLVDQARDIGGNIFRRSIDSSSGIYQPSLHKKQWHRILNRFQSQKARISILCETRFAGIDHQGTALITAISDKRYSKLCQPSALILATGATERVLPRPGSELAGVMTAGAIQSQMKSAGEAPLGKVLLAGSGPLLLAVGAQLTKLGNPPVAIIEASRPFYKVIKSIQLPGSYIKEAALYLYTLGKARVPIFTNAHVTSIKDTAKSLCITVKTSTNKQQLFHVDHVGLHDGFKENDYGQDLPGNLLVCQTGDCRETLGARAAELDGLSTGNKVVEQLNGGSPTDEKTSCLNKERCAQALLKSIYAYEEINTLMTMPDSTLICRCENKTLGDLRALDNPTVREARLLGRFAMGACQGRFCSEWVDNILAASQNRKVQHSVSRHRWPIQPISVRSIIEAEEIPPVKLNKPSN